MSEGYNGWANWQTWNVSLWLNNDEGLYRSALEYLRPTTTGYRVTARDFEMFMRDLLPDGTPDMDSRHEYDGVDWQEILDGFQEDVETT